MRFIKGCGFETKIKTNTRANTRIKNVCTAINVTNPLVSLTGEALVYENSDYFNSLNDSYYLSQVSDFMEHYSTAIINAIDFNLIHPNQLPNLRPTTIDEAKESINLVRNLLANVPVKLVEQLMPHVDTAKKDLIAGGVPTELIEEFDAQFSPEFDFAYNNSELVFETPSIEGCLIVNIDSFRSNSKAASALVSLLCKGNLFDQGHNAAYYNHMESGEPITDTKTIAQVNKLLSSKLDLDELQGQTAWVKLALPLLALIEKNYDIEVSESILMNFNDLDTDRLAACDEDYVDELATSRLSIDFELEELVTFYHRILTRIASFSYLASRFQDPEMFSKLNNKKASSAKILTAIYDVASKATDNGYLEIDNEDHVGLRTFVLTDYVCGDNEAAYSVIDDVYNHAYEVNELTLNYKVSLTDSDMTTVRNTLINSYCMNFLSFLSQRSKQFSF
ncbi:hypothetical protein [Pseudoalteromonas sp. MelDa3]|uniref:hypothetical protein n=1 Tax=Pseudoalteromonas sp. MelDa3 TaxID=888435 RepID=UPI000CC94572|nr:hypothetical protein [Pseudoalteromonas sp. MelDa3]PLT25110.1 hypothetical protein CXF89_12235 [Pseudoalteromonas sp. MelDa3]